MEFIRHAIYVINPGMFLAFLDINHAFYYILVHKTHHKVLQFLIKGKALQFIAMPNDCIHTMHVFNNVLKPSFAYLREQGLSSVEHVNDTLLEVGSFEEHQNNVLNTLSCLDYLGFYIHREKSIFTPKQDIIYLGYHINTLRMTSNCLKETKNYQNSLRTLKKKY